jgi:hypothetical protein
MSKGLIDNDRSDVLEWPNRPDLSTYQLPRYSVQLPFASAPFPENASQILKDFLRRY